MKRLDKREWRAWFWWLAERDLCPCSLVYRLSGGRWTWGGRICERLEAWW